MNAIADIVSSLDVPALSVPAPLADAALADHVADLRQLLVRMRRIHADWRRNLPRRQAERRTLLESLRCAPAVELEEAVERLWVREQEWQRNLAHIETFGRRLEARVKRIRPHITSLVHQLAELAQADLIERLKMIRDTRWEVLAILAENTPAASEPVLSTRADLESYFRSLPPAA